MRIVSTRRAAGSQTAGQGLEGAGLRQLALLCCVPAHTSPRPAPLQPIHSASPRLRAPHAHRAMASLHSVSQRWLWSSRFFLATLPASARRASTSPRGTDCRRGPGRQRWVAGRQGASGHGGSEQRSPTARRCMRPEASQLGPKPTHLPPFRHSRKRAAAPARGGAGGSRTAAPAAPAGWPLAVCRTRRRPRPTLQGTRGGGWQGGRILSGREAHQRTLLSPIPSACIGCLHLTAPQNSHRPHPSPPRAARPG